MEYQRFKSLEEIQKAIKHIIAVREDTRAKEHLYYQYLGKENGNVLMKATYENYNKQLDELYDIERNFIKN